MRRRRRKSAIDLSRMLHKKQNAGFVGSSSDRGICYFSAKLQPMCDVKRRRLVELLKLRVNNRRLAEIANRFRSGPRLLEEPLTRHQLDRATLALYDDIGETIELARADGTTFDWYVANVPKLLQHFVNISAVFKGLLTYLFRSVRSLPHSPWHWNLYMDECVPGNVLRLDNARKSWTFYLSISELGGAIQQCEGAWMPIAILRECEVKKISNGFSQCVRALLRRLLLGSSNMREHGVVLPVDRGRPAVVSSLLVP